MVAERRKFPTWIVAAGICLLVIVVWAAVWALKGPDPDRGTWGDMFGGANALYSGLALAFVVLAIMLQSRELELQRAELALTRKELTGQRLEMEQQTETFRLQIFESSFLTLLGQLRGITASVGWQVGGAVGPRSYGPEAMQHIADTVRARAQQDLQKRSAPEAIAEAFHSIRGHWASAGISGFLSFLEELAQWITEAPKERQARYRSMLLAQLSQPERDVAALYCATPDGDYLRSALAHKWQLLKPSADMRVLIERALPKNTGGDVSNT